MKTPENVGKDIFYLLNVKFEYFLSHISPGLCPVLFHLCHKLQESSGDESMGYIKCWNDSNGKNQRNYSLLQNNSIKGYVIDNKKQLTTAVICSIFSHSITIR